MDVGGLIPVTTYHAYGIELTIWYHPHEISQVWLPLVGA